MLMDSNIDIKITNNKEFEREVDKIKFQKMVFLYNALDTPVDSFNSLHP